MALSKQAKVLNKNQINAVLNYLSHGRNSKRNVVMFLLSVNAGLRAKEIAALQWQMLTDADGNISSEIRLTNEASKGNSGRVIPISQRLRGRLENLFDTEEKRLGFKYINRVVRTERSEATNPQAVVNMFSKWYRDLGLIGCSSHSGRRTFITNAARNISTVGGSLRDVQYLAGHSSLQTTERYIEYSEKAHRSIVDVI